MAASSSSVRQQDRKLFFLYSLLQRSAQVREMATRKCKPSWRLLTQWHNTSSVYLTSVLFIYLFVLRQGIMLPRLASNFLYSQGCPWTLDTSAITSWVLGLQMSNTVLALCSAGDGTQNFVGDTQTLYQLNYINGPIVRFCIHTQCLIFFSPLWQISGRNKLNREFILAHSFRCLVSDPLPRCF